MNTPCQRAARPPCPLPRRERLGEGAARVARGMRRLQRRRLDPPTPAARPDAAARCGIDSVEIARIERLLRETPPEDLLKIFSERELQDSGEGPGRAASLAARFAAKEACLKLFPRETALGTISVGRLLGRTRQLRRPAGRVRAGGARCAGPQSAARHRAVADPRSHQRLGRRARAADAHASSAVREAALSPAALSPRSRPGEPAARIRRQRVRKTRSRGSRRRTTRTSGG